MTDADKLREIAEFVDDEMFNSHDGDNLRRIADLLDAIPTETLAALKAGSWRAIPKKPTNAMLFAGNEIGLVGYDSLGSKAVYRAMLAAAPAKP